MLSSGLKYLPAGVSAFALATAFSFAAGLALDDAGAAMTDVTAMPSATAETAANIFFMESPQQRADRVRLSAATLAEGMAGVTGARAESHDFVRRAAPANLHSSRDQAAADWRAR